MSDKFIQMKGKDPRTGKEVYFYSTLHFHKLHKDGSIEFVFGEEYLPDDNNELYNPVDDE